MKTTNISKATEGAIISDQQAVQIATEAVKNVSYDRNIGVSVQHEPGRYIVTFPVKKPVLPPGRRYRGPDYAAKVIVDEKTGKIIQIKVGS